jgi:hypothetical protein
MILAGGKGIKRKGKERKEYITLLYLYGICRIPLAFYTGFMPQRLSLLSDK